MTFKDLGINLTEKQKQQFEDYYAFLISENQKYNLTAITNKEEVYVKHFYDSLTLVKTGLIKEGISLCDIGSGAGFPSIPLKIVFPHIKLTIIEAQTKKTRFLKALVDKLGLDVEILNIRAENYEKKNHFDIVTARAVAHLQILSELCIPFVKSGGHFIAMKGAYEEELSASLSGLRILGSSFVKAISLVLPSNMGERNLLIIQKNKKIFNYPRPYAQMKKNPL